MHKSESSPTFSRGMDPRSFIERLAPSRRQGERKASTGTLQNNLQLSYVIKAGIYNESPFDKVYADSKYRYIDYAIFDKWARKIWKSKLVHIGPRIVGTRWLGSFGMSDASYRRLILHMLDSKEIWFSTFWRQDEQYMSVKFCLDCSECFSAVIRKLFQPGSRNGTYTDFTPKKGDKLDVLIGTVWGAMNKEQCGEKCPWRKCEGCLGAYWGKCDGPKRIEAFPSEARNKKET